MFQRVVTQDDSMPLSTSNAQGPDLPPLQTLQLDAARIQRIMAQVLQPMQAQPQLLVHYADHVLQAQQQIMAQQSGDLAGQLSQAVEAILQRLQQSGVILQTRRYSRWQRWLGLDLERQARQDDLYYTLDRQVKVAHQLSQQVQRADQGVLAQLDELTQLRLDMAHMVAAAEQFVQRPGLDTHFQQRLQQKISTLLTAQLSHDLALAQLQLVRQVNLNVLDRFYETIAILIPAWQQQQLSLQQQHVPGQLAQLNASRQQLLHTLNQMTPAVCPVRSRPVTDSFSGDSP